MQASSQDAAAQATTSAVGAVEADSSTGSLKVPKEASASAVISVLGKRPSARSGNPKQKAAKQKGIAGQSSLKAFMKPQTAPRPEQTAPSGLVYSISAAAKCYLPSLELNATQQTRNQVDSHSVQPRTGEAERQDQLSSCMPDAVQHNSVPQRMSEGQDLDRMLGSVAAPIQSKVGCASSKVDDVDELVDAATQWEDTKGIS